MNIEEQLQLTNETLYKHSREIAVKNKVLSFLSRLYEISTHTLEQKQLAEQVALALQTEFDFEIVGIYLYHSSIDELSPLSVVVSERIQGLLPIQLDTINFQKVSVNEFFSPAILKETMLYSEQLTKIWQHTELTQACTNIEQEKYIRSSFGYPLIIGNTVFGVVMISLNRTYEDLIDYEREAMRDFMNVISITLNRVTLYEELGLANEKLKELDKMKSEFVSIASHQLRSPLTAIRGYSSMLLEGSFGQLPVKAKEAVDHINEASRFMASSVEDYLNVSRIQAGNMKYEYSDFNLNDIAQRVAEDTKQLAEKKGLLLSFRSELVKIGIVHADIGKTRQVIDNLLNNSLKYTPKGTISVFVHDDVKLKKIYVDISDTGIGMNPKTSENIFGKFERADNANEVNVTGTGLGLYIARKMTREMGGEITATSEGEGRGSLFRIELPLLL